MKKSITYILSFLFISLNVFSQQLDKEVAHSFKSLKKDSYIGNVEYDSDTKVTSLFYVEKNALNTVFTTYRFDENLKFLDQDIKKYSIVDGFKDALDNFKWFNFQGENIVKEVVTVDQGWGGKLVVRKSRWSRIYNWNFGIYTSKYENIETKKIQGLEGDRIYLYDRFNNLETGEVILLVGIKPPKGQNKEAKFQHARKYQLMKITPDFQVEYGEFIEFKHNMVISFKRSLATNAQIEQGENNDISKANVSLIFTPLKSMLGKKWQSENPENHTMIIVNDKGEIASRIDITAPTSGWVVEDLVVANGGKDVYYYGPAKDGAYVNSLMPTNSPLTGRDEVKDIKYKNFQIMKITDNKLAWINNTDLKEFQTKAVTPPSQKKSPEYKGKNFTKSVIHVTQNGELVIAGQKYTTKQVPVDKTKPDGPKKTIYTYKDLVMFHFNNKGDLKAQYGIRRDKNNKYAKSSVTPQYVYENKEGTQLYWVYGEIKGLRGGINLTGGFLELAGASTLSKRKLLFYPTVAKVDLDKGKMGDFIPLGADADGKQLYFTNPEFPQMMTKDYSNLIFVGEDKRGSLVWLAKMKID